MEFNGLEDERMFLESWFTKCDENSVNICRDMPGAYAGQIAHECRLACLERTRRSFERMIKYCSKFCNCE